MEEKKDVPYKPGEKGFALFLLLFGLYATSESWKLYQMSPGASSFGAVPLFVSALIVIFSAAILITDRKKLVETAGLSGKEKVMETLRYIFPLDVSVTMVLILLYCAGLYLGLGFVPVASVFLWASMSYLMHKGYVKNLLWTALCMAFILLVFSFLFSVVLP